MHIDRVYVSDVGDIRKMVLKEMHDVPSDGHSVYQKIAAAIRKQYYWPRMNNDVAEYLDRCMECQKVKLSINIQEDCCGPFQYQNGNGM